MSMTPEEFTKEIVDKFARPVGDPERLMFWDPRPHALRLLAQALTGVVGEKHPLAKIVNGYIRADIIATKFSHISEYDANEISLISSDIDIAHDDLQEALTQWEDAINDMLRGDQ